jgi:hypothetical protein
VKTPFNKMSEKELYLRGAEVLEKINASLR